MISRTATIALLSCVSGVSTFTPSVPVAVLEQHKLALAVPSLLHMQPRGDLTPFLLSDEFTDAIPSDGGGFFDILRNIALGLTAIVFLLAGLTYLVASIIIPAAAKQLEEQCKELDPELWDEYVARLPEGTTMAQNPDLMQELGNKLQPLLDKKLAQMEEDGTAKVTDMGFGAGKMVEYAEDAEIAPAVVETSTPDVTPSAPAPSTSPPVQDAEVIEPVILDVSSMSGNMWADDDEEEKKKKKSND